MKGSIRAKGIDTKSIPYVNVLSDDHILHPSSIGLNKSSAILFGQ